MYIRKTKTSSNKDKNYYSFRLVESIRTPTGKVSQKTLLNLGNKYSVTAEHEWPLLTDLIASKLAGITPLFRLSDAIENEAQRLINLIIGKHGNEIGSSKTCNKHYEAVDINGLDNTNVKSIGAETLAYEAAKKLNFPSILLECGLNQKQLNIALGSVIGRLLSPGSEVKTADYLRNKSALDEVLGTDFSSLHRNKLYELSDLLLKHKNQIESKLFDHEKSCFNFQEIVTLFDLTNTYFEGQSKQNENAALGRSKEKRSDCMLVSLALVLDGSGFPKRSHVYKGNVSEPGTLQERLKLESKDAIIVMDAGIATEDNIKWLTEHDYKYLVVSRKRNQEIPESIEGVVVKEDSQNKVTSYLMNNEATKETELYCHSKAMEEKGQALKSKFQKRFVDELQKLSNGLTKKGCTKKYDKIHEKIGRLKEKYSKVAYAYDIEVVADQTKKQVLEIKWQHHGKAEGKSSGIYCIRTNQTKLDHHEIWQIYRMLNEVESAFRTLKTDLGMRPVYHQQTDRITGHIFISLLAYHLLHSIRYQLKNHDINDSWATIMSKLENHYRMTTSLQRKDGKTLHVRKTMRANPRQLKIYQACQISSIPLKTIIKEY